eukprot:5173693-Amphidinium_carterae.1
MNVQPTNDQKAEDKRIRPRHLRDPLVLQDLSLVLARFPSKVRVPQLLVLHLLWLRLPLEVLGVPANALPPAEAPEVPPPPPTDGGELAIPDLNGALEGTLPT